MKFSGAIAAALTLGSAFAAPVVQKKAVSPLETITSLIAGLKTDVAAELASIPLVGDVEATAVPLVQAALTSVVGKVQGVASEITPLVFGLALPLVEEEAQSVLAVVGDLKETVTGIQTTVKGFVGVATSDVVSTLKPEIQSVVGVVGTVATPVTTLAFSVINSLPAGSLVTSELTTVVGDLQSLVNGLLAPVEGLLAGLGLNL